MWKSTSELGHAIEQTQLGGRHRVDGVISTLVYFNLFDTFAKIATQEGPLALWRGFIPMWARIAPTTTLQLLFFEKFTKLAGISAT